MSPPDHHSDHHSGAVTLPPLFFIAAFAAGFALEQIWPLPVLPEALRIALASLFAALGIALAVATVARFVRHRTSLHVHRPTTALITDGPFRLSRNPAYLALTLLYAAGAVALDSVWIMALLLPALAGLHWGVIVREERYLEGLFGEAYRDYRARVRRWL